MNAKMAYALGALVLSCGVLQAGGRVPLKQDIPKYIKQLKSSTSAKERAQAADMIGRRGQVVAADVKTAIDPLLKTLKDDSSTEVRQAAATALGNIATQADTVVPVLISSLKDSSMEVNLAVVRALAGFGAEARSAVQPLRAFAKDKVKDKKKDRNIAMTVNLAIKQISSSGK